MTQHALRSLTDLGLNTLEAEVYLFLLAQGEPVTAYRAGKALGKATANVYKAIEALSLKGAVTLEDSEPRLCRAAPAEEFMGQLERQFQEQKRRASKALAHLAPPAGGERIYRLETVPAILERAAAMLRRAEKVAILDAFPETLKATLGPAQEAAQRGVRVRVQAYQEIEIEKVAEELEVTLIPRRREALGFWKSQQLNLVIDGREALLALVSNDLAQVHQAFWTDSLYLSCLLHAGMGMEQTVHAIETLAGDARFPAELRALLEAQGFFYNSELPGQQELFRRLGLLQVEDRS